jgi:hypothetical protein
MNALDSGFSLSVIDTMHTLDVWCVLCFTTVIRSTTRGSPLSHHGDDALKDPGRSTAPPLIDQVGVDPAYLNKIFTPAAGRINGGQHHDGKLEAVKHLRPRRRHEWVLRPGLELVDGSLELRCGCGIRAAV